MTAAGYYESALNHIATGTRYRIKHDGQWKWAYVTRIGADRFMYTSTTMNGRIILTHMFNVSAKLLGIWEYT
jgi:hypothetical protein